MINVVHWKDVVGKEFLPEFIKIMRAIIAVEMKDPPESASVVLNKLSDETRENYKTKRALMRKCGYLDRKDPSPYIWHGWYRPYFDRDEVKFLCTAPKEERRYIALPTFLEWKRVGNIDDEMDRYYETQDLIQKVANDEGGFIG